MDEQLRRLERAWRASGEEAEHLRWLQERLRHGEREEDLSTAEQAVVLRSRLDRKRLAVAAHCGSEEAASALETTIPDRSARWLEQWFFELERIGDAAVLRQVVVILAGGALAMVSLPDDSLLEVLDEALEAWAESPGSDEVEALGEAQRELEGVRGVIPRRTTEALALSALDELIEAGKLGQWDEVWAAAGKLPAIDSYDVQGLLAAGLIPWALAR